MTMIIYKYYSYQLGYHVLKKSMSVWINKFILPVFFFFTCKPHPNDNEHHTISCGDICIIHGWYLFKGWYHTIKVWIPEFETSCNIKTSGLVIQINISLWSTVKSVIMYSSLCVLRGILEMRNRGVYVI